MTVPEVRALLRRLLDKRDWTNEEILWWSTWRQERNRLATACHRKRRRAELAKRSKVS